MQFLSYFKFCLVLFHLILLANFSASASDISPQFHFVLPTPYSTHIPSRSGSFRIEFRNAPLSEMGEALRRCKSADLLPDFSQKTPVLYIYLPSKEMFYRWRYILAYRARQQFDQLYPGSDLRIRFRVIRTNINVTYMHSRVANVLQELKEQLNSDEETQSQIAKLSQANDEAFQDTVNSLEITGPVARKVKYSIATARFFIVAATRSAQTVTAFAARDVTTAAALTLIVADSSAEFFTVALTQKIQRLFSKGPLRLTATRLQALISRAINNAIWNLALMSVGRPTVMQEMGHLSNPAIPAPTIGSIENILGISTVGVGFYALFTNAYNSLRDKGWVSSSQIDMALHVSGVFDLATGIMNSNPNWYFYRWFTLGPQWAFYAFISLLNRLAPARSDTMLAIETSVVDWRDVHEEQTADMSFHVNEDSDFSRAQTLIQVARQTTDPHCEKLLIPWQSEPPRREAESEDRKESEPNLNE